MNNLIAINGEPIWHESTDFLLNKNELDFIKNNEFYKSGLHKGYVDNTWLTNDIQLLNKPELNRLHNFIIEKFNIYKKNLLQIKNNFIMSNSWATKCYVQERVLEHHHSNSMFSFVYYPQVDNDKITFDFRKSKLQESWNFDYDIDEYNIFNSAKWDINIKNGDFVMFPSHINHSTTLNKNNIERISIAGNFFIDDKVSSAENTISLKCVGLNRNE